MKVTLISYTQDALELLLFTKQTRLSMDAGLMEEIQSWTPVRKQQELAYMLGTIKSSWEFVNYVFSIEGVTRAFTHQLVRTRHASFAQQSQRTVDMQDFEYLFPTGWHPETHELLMTEYYSTMNKVRKGYSDLIELGAPPQDARGILPTNVSTNIIVGANLRTLSEMARIRLCTRTQGEYQTVFRLIREEVLKVHAWSEPFLRVACAAEGVCCFPNYEECPIKPGVFNPDTGFRWDWVGLSQITRPLTKDEIQVRWENTNFEAVPRQMTKEEE